MRQQRKKQPKNRLRKFIIDSLIILAMTFVIVLLTEVFLRLFFPQNLVGTSIIGKTFSNENEFLGIRYTPGVKWHFDHPEYSVEYEINKHGFRDRKDHLIPKPKGVNRVLLVGDSFTFGYGVDYDDSWPVIVEQRVEKTGINRIDFVKAGIEGMDTRTEFLLIKDLLLKYQCDVVVLGFLINDLYTNTLYGIEDEKENLTKNDAVGKIRKMKNVSGDSWLEAAKRVFIRNDRNHNFHLLTLTKRIAIANDDIYCKLYLASPDRKQWLSIPLSSGYVKKRNITKLIFEKIAEYCYSFKKKLIVLSIPQQFQVLYFEQSKKSANISVTVYDRYFSEVAKLNNFAWITTLDEFHNSKFNKDGLFYRLDGHLTPLGNQVVAEAFLQKIVPMFNGKQ